jgi:copper(I)-binding protein
MIKKYVRQIAALVALGVVISGFAIVVACGSSDDAGSAAAPTPVATLGKLQILDPWVRMTTNDVSALYLTVKNGGAADTLVKVTSDVSDKAQMHENVVDGASSSMKELPNGIAVPANGDLSLDPGGYHVMLMDLKAPLKVGDTVQVELTFAQAGTVKVTVPVTAGDAATP